MNTNYFTTGCSSKTVKDFVYTLACDGAIYSLAYRITRAVYLILRLRSYAILWLPRLACCSSLARAVKARSRVARSSGVTACCSLQYDVFCDLLQYTCTRKNVIYLFYTIKILTDYWKSCGIFGQQVRWCGFDVIYVCVL